MPLEDTAAPILSHEAYRATFVEDDASGVGRIELRLTDGRLRTAYSAFNLVDETGRTVDQPRISAANAQLVLDAIAARGLTEGFNIAQAELAAGRVLSRSGNAEVEAVRHLSTTTERSFTATGEKLLHHLPIIKKYAETGYGSIIRATMTLHQACSSSCPYCSTIFRKKVDSISLDEAKRFVTELYDDQAEFNRARFPDYNADYRARTGTDIRLRGLILSGGGQPNIWPHFAKFTEWLGERDLDLGLITNGFPPKIPDDTYRRFKWVRLSITPEDASPHYVDGRFDLQRIPESLVNNPDVTFGLSYVYGPWTTDDLILRIRDFIDRVGARYCRFLTDCTLGRTAQLKAHEDLAERLYKLDLITAEGEPKAPIFHQLKYHGTPAEGDALWDEGQCFLQTFNVFWDTSGHADAGKSYCYPCDSVTVLAEEGAESQNAPERRFNHEKWGTVTNDRVAELFDRPVAPFFDPRKLCSACLFMRNNQVFKSLSRTTDWDAVERPTSLEHVNFP